MPLAIGSNVAALAPEVSKAFPCLTKRQPLLSRCGIPVQSYGMPVQNIWDSGAQIWDTGAVASSTAPGYSHSKRTEESLRPTAKMICLRPSTTNDKKRKHRGLQARRHEPRIELPWSQVL